MKKINIVKSNEEFNNIIKTGNCVKNYYFVLYYKENSLGKYRFGISVGKKVCNAVKRNYLKRIVKNILDNHKNLYSKSRDYIIIIRKNCLNVTYQNLEQSIISLMAKIDSLIESAKEN